MSFLFLFYWLGYIYFMFFVSCKSPCKGNASKLDVWMERHMFCLKDNYRDFRVILCTMIFNSWVIPLLMLYCYMTILLLFMWPRVLRDFIHQVYWLWTLCCYDYQCSGWNWIFGTTHCKYFVNFCKVLFKANRTYYHKISFQKFYQMSSCPPNVDQIARSFMSTMQ